MISHSFHTPMCEKWQDFHTFVFSHNFHTFSPFLINRFFHIIFLQFSHNSVCEKWHHFHTSFHTCFIPVSHKSVCEIFTRVSHAFHMCFTQLLLVVIERHKGSKTCKRQKNEKGENVVLGRSIKRAKQLQDIHVEKVKSKLDDEIAAQTDWANQIKKVC